MASAAKPAVAPAVPGGTGAKPKKGGAVKELKAKKPAAQRKPRSPSSHPPFLEMITNAIVALKERTGSSQYAISKFIEEKHKQLPINFKKLLLVHLKRLVASGKLLKVKNSFKLSPARSSPSTTTVAAGKKPAAAKQKPKSDAAKAKQETAGAKRKAKADGGASKTSKTAAKSSPGKKKAVSAAVKPKKSGNAKKVVAVVKTKKLTPVKSVKKPKSVKSPAKKAAAKKTKK